MREVNIEIEDRKLNELGIEQLPDYTPFRFKESAFSGYWKTKNLMTKEGILEFYVGSETFHCKDNQRNIDIFESILNNENKTCK